MWAAAIPFTIPSLNTDGTIAIKAVCSAHPFAVFSQAVYVIVGVARFLCPWPPPQRP